MKPGYSEKEKAAKPTSFENSRQLNGRPKMPRVDSFSRFSEPPAPPPQQPLPEKPDAPPRSGSDSFSPSPLKRSETDKPRSASSNSPVTRDSSQILSLIEALSSAKREIDNQGARVKELEDMLLQERAARESAEERVRKLETRSASDEEGSESESVIHYPKDEAKIKLEHNDWTIGTPIPAEISAPSAANQKEPSTEVNTAQLQRRLEHMMEEMEEMRKQMASFKERAEKAEDESTESRKSLAEMIETLRKERAEKESTSATAKAQGQDPMEISSGHIVPTGNDSGESKVDGSSPQRFDPVTSKSKELDAAATAFATQRRRNFLEEASPYTSMFGVVLLGVGLMAYLNGWQKMDK